MLRAALIGLGNIAWKYDANKPDSPFALSQGGAFLKDPRIELVGGCSPDASDRIDFLKWRPGVLIFSTPEEMLEKLHPDIVGICSPSETHYDHARMCLEAGVPMLWLEKPPTLRIEDLSRLISLADKNKVTVCVNYFRRYLPSYQKLKKLILSRHFGSCHTIRLTYSPGLARNGIHLLDQIFFLTDANNYELLWVEQDGDKDAPSFALRLPEGQLVLGCGGGVNYHTNDISIQCEKGILAITHGGKSAIVEESLENDLFPGFLDLHATKEKILGNVNIDAYMQNALSDLVYSRLAHIQPQSNLTSSYLSQQLMDDILRGACR